MNKFETSFFQKYIPEGQEIKGIIHIHFIDVFSEIFLWLSMGAILPSFIYFYSELIHNNIPFYFLESLLIIVFIKTIYEVFNRYNDVWIITNNSIITLNRTLFKTDSNSIVFDKIEGMEVEQDGIIDKIFNKGNLIIHKFGDDSLILKNTINPYNAINLIEEIDNQLNETTELEENKYDIIMDALGGVVENYLEKKDIDNQKQKEINKKLEKIENSEGTIDLR